MRTPREVVLAWVDAFNCHDAHAAAALYHEDAVNLQVPNGQPVVGRDATLTAFLHIMQAFPDNSTRVVNLFEDGPWVIIDWEFSGTYVGAFQGNPPNGRTFKLQGCELFQVGIKVAYLGTQRDLGVILEIFNGLPDGKQKPDAT